MLNIKVGDVFYTNRLGYSNVLPKENRETIYDHLGYITITITKVNKKTFKTTHAGDSFNTLLLFLLAFSFSNLF
jgi:hypothetical protein